MNNKELEQGYRKYQRLFRTLLTMCGCWYMPTKSGKSTYYWTICLLTIVISYLTMSLHMIYICRHNLTIMMKYIGISITSIGVIFKIGTFLMNRGSLINYHQTLNDLFEQELGRNEEIRTIMLSSLPIIRTMTYTYNVILGCLMFGFYSPPYISIIRNLSHFHLTTNYTLPGSRGYGYFWTVSHNSFYHFYLLFETSAAIGNSITTSCIDCIFGLYVYQFASVMRAMAFSLTNPTDTFSDTLRTCLTKHQRLIPCRDILEHIYGPIIFWHIITNAVLLVALIYEVMDIVATAFSIFELVAVATYGIIKLLETFMYAWYGTMLTDASEAFHNGIYFGEWPKSDLDHHVRTNIILMMIQKPMTINAVFSSVDMNMFTNFVNTTISYFFLLQSIGDKGE